MTADPIFAAFAQHAEQRWALVDAGQVDRHDVMAGLVSDALALSVVDGVDPATADDLLALATEWATLRRTTLLAAALLDADPIPDDLGDLDGGAP